MKFVEGCRSPLELFGGDVLKNVRILEHYWRVNSYQTGRENNYKVRLGCHFVFS